MYQGISTIVCDVEYLLDASHNLYDVESVSLIAKGEMVWFYAPINQTNITLFTVQQRR